MTFTWGLLACDIYITDSHTCGVCGINGIYQHPALSMAHMCCLSTCYTAHTHRVASFVYSTSQIYTKLQLIILNRNDLNNYQYDIIEIKCKKGKSRVTLRCLCSASSMPYAMAF